MPNIALQAIAGDLGSMLSRSMGQAASWPFEFEDCYLLPVPYIDFGNAISD
jgi:hypothetical protein